eukprot:Gb_17826 [translate_table: standard]
MLASCFLIPALINSETDCSTGSWSTSCIVVSIARCLSTSALCLIASLMDFSIRKLLHRCSYSANASFVHLDAREVALRPPRNSGILLSFVDTEEVCFKKLFISGILNLFECGTWVFLLEDYFPQSLKVGIPKLTIKDDKAQALITSTFEEIQNAANKQFLEAYLLSINKAKENARAAVNATTVQFQEILKNLCETLSSVHFLGGLNATSLASKWMNEALAEYEQQCKNFLIEKSIKDAIRQSVEAERQREVDTAMQEVDQLPVEQSVSELINAGIKKQDASMLKEITRLKNLVRQLTNCQQSGNTTLKEDKAIALRANIRCQERQNRCPICYTARKLDKRERTRERQRPRSRSRLCLNYWGPLRTLLDKPTFPVKLARALQSIRKDESIIIKLVDKNLGLVVMDKYWYYKEGLRQLCNPLVYERVDMVPWELLWSKLRKLVDSFGDLFPGAEDYLLTNPPSKAKPIPTKEGLAALREMIEEDVSKEGSFSNHYIDMIMQFAELILTEH